jgi:hypothetical protein
MRMPGLDEANVDKDGATRFLGCELYEERSDALLLDGCTFFADVFNEILLGTLDEDRGKFGVVVGVVGAVVSGAGGSLSSRTSRTSFTVFFFSLSKFFSIKLILPYKKTLLFLF